MVEVVRGVIADGQPFQLHLRQADGRTITVELRIGGGDPARERIARLREKHPNAYLPWTAEDDRRLRELHQQAVGIAELARTFGRQPSAIRSRLAKVLPPHPSVVPAGR